MKNSYRFIFAITLLFGVSASEVFAHASPCWDTAREKKKPKQFSRTFDFSKRKIANPEKTKSTLEITFEDFQEHTKVGTKRNFLSAEPENGTIPMNVGVIDIDGTASQSWTLPNLEGYEGYSLDLEHITVESSGFEGYYSEVNQAIKIGTDGTVQMNTLDQDEFFMYGYSEPTGPNGEQEMIDYYGAMSTVPLKIGESYTGTVVFEYTEDPDYDSTVYLQHYDVVGYGILKLPNGDTDEAIKLIFTEEETDYKEGAAVAYSSYDEFVWYTKTGHYVRAGVDDAWNQEGKTELHYINYQWIEKVTGLEDFTSYSLNLFPNPIAKGETLNLQATADFTPNSIELYNIQGKKVSEIQPNENNPSQFALPNTVSSGLYFYLAHDKKKNGLAKGKIMVE